MTAILVGVTVLVLGTGVAFSAQDTITTVVGTGPATSTGDGGLATAATINDPADVGVGPDGDLYVAEAAGHRIRRVNSATGVITTIAGNGVASTTGDGGPATSATINQPRGLQVDSQGTVYFAESGGNVVRKITSNGIISRVAGTGTAGYTGDGGSATSATLNRPRGLTIAADGSILVADRGNNVIRKITPGGTISTIAGTGVQGHTGDNGPATSAQLNVPTDIVVDPAGGYYIAEQSGDTVRRVSSGGTITTFAGTGTGGFSGDGGPATAAMLNSPTGVEVGRSGELFISDNNNNRVRRVGTNGVITTIVGDGSATSTGDGGPASAATITKPARLTDTGKGLYITESNTGNRVRLIAGSGVAAPTVSSVTPSSPANNNSPQVTGTADANTTVRLYTNSTCTSAVAGTGTAAQFASTGVSASVADDSTTTFYATATDAWSTVSPCSATSATYVEDSTAPAAPTITGAPTTPGNGRSPSWSWTGEAGGSYKCQLDRGGTVISGYGACTSAKSYDLTGQPDGTYTFSVKQTDSAGNTGSVQTSDYALDTTAPAAPTITGGPPTYSNNPSPTYTFTAEGGATTECRIERSGVAIYDWASCSSGQSFALSLQSDGTYDFLVRARDTAGNTGATATRSFTLDRGTPAAPVITVSPTSPGSGRSPSWSFSGEAGATFRCQLDRGGTVVSAYASCTSANSYDLTGEPDGTYTFSVTQTDQAGNTGTAQTSTYTLDTTAPAAPAITASPTTPGNSRSPSWSFTGEAGGSYQCKLTSGATVIDDWRSCTSAKAYDLTGQPDATYTFAVKQTDTAGNTGTATTGDYVLDTTAPAAPSITASPSSPGTLRTPSWSFTAEAGARTECRLDNGGTQIADWGTCASPWSFDLSAHFDGPYTVGIRAIDAAGNTSASSSDTYTLDTTAPAAPSFTSRPSSPGRSYTPAWSISAEAGATLECRVDRGATQIDDWALCSSSKTADLTGKIDGTYTLSVRATDSAGNVGAVAADSYVLDTAAPAAPAVTSSPAATGHDRSPAWSFSAEAGATTECRMDRGSTTVAGWATCTSPHTFDLTGEPDGAYTVSFRATDAAGNVSATSTGTYTLDTSAPAAPAITSAPSDPANDVSPRWDFSAEAGATLECRLDRGATQVSDWSACTSPESYDLSSEPDGTYTFSTRATDPAGNVSATATSSFTLDTSLPLAPTIDGSPGPFGYTRAPSWSFSDTAGLTFECRLDQGATQVSGWVPCTSPHAFDLTGQPEAAYTFSVRAINAANTRGAPTTDSYTLDVTPPAAPSIDSAPVSPGNARTATWSFSAEAGARLECHLGRGATEISPWTACTSPTGFDLSGEPDGVYTLSVRATDQAGNTGAAATSAYTLDTTPPAAPTISASPASPGSNAVPQWSFTGEPGATFECRVDGGSTPVATWGPCSSPHSHDLSSQPDGSYMFAVRATDAAGNTSPVSASGAYELDRTGAAVRFDGAPGPIGRDRRPAWAFSSEPGASFECTLGILGGGALDASQCASPHTADLTARPDGAYTFSVRAADAVGNNGAPATETYILDTIAPGRPVLKSTPPDVGNDRSPTWGFTGESGATLMCSLKAGRVPVYGWNDCTSPRTFSLRARDDGVYRVLVRARDEAGNIGLPVAGDYELDTTPPDPPAIDVKPESPSDDRTPTWMFSGEHGARFECKVMRGSGVIAAPRACTRPFTSNLSDQATGTYTFSVRAVDAAGNESGWRTDDYVLAPPSSGPPGDSGGSPANPSPGRTRTPPNPDRMPRLMPAAHLAHPQHRAAGGHRSHRAAARHAPRRRALAAPPAARAARGHEHRSWLAELIAKAEDLAVGAAAKGAFPLLVLIVCGLFVAVQDRIDRRDPKLALAPLFADPELEFIPKAKLGDPASSPMCPSDADIGRKPV